MARQHRQRLAPLDMDEIWRRMRGGHSMKPTARALGLPTSTVRSYLVRCGGIMRNPRHRGSRRLSLAEREEISRGLAAGRSLRRSRPSLVAPHRRSAVRSAATWAALPGHCGRPGSLGAGMT